MTVERFKSFLVLKSYWFVISFMLITFLTSLSMAEVRFVNSSLSNVRIKRSYEVNLFKNKNKQHGQYFPIALYTVRHHRPGNGVSSRRIRPEVWEYRGQYFYGFRQKQKNRQMNKLLIYSIPVLLAPLLSLIFTLPVVLPVTVPAVVPAGNGGRKKREIKSEMEDKVTEIATVARYLHQVRYDESQQVRLVANYLQCNGLLDSDNHCMERLSCEFADPKNAFVPELERTVTSILLGHILKNAFIPKAFKNRLKSAAVYVTQHQGQCSRFFCAQMEEKKSIKEISPSI